MYTATNPARRGFMTSKHIFVCAIALLLAAPSLAQLREIDAAKLPQDAAVQHAYKDLLPIEQYAQNWSQKWPYQIPQDQVVARFTLALATFQAAQKADPGNTELALCTGLVAHLAYNLDLQTAYEPAMTLLGGLVKTNPTDYRAAWFLGMHKCQSNDSIGGMKDLLPLESGGDRPAAFWLDDATCATVTFMPAHALRAYDKAIALGDHSPSTAALVERLHNQSKQSSATATYPSHDVWRAEKEGASVRFTSQVCGESFLSDGDWHIDISDVAKGSCVVQVTPGSYPTRLGRSSPTLLLFTQTPRPSETLDAFRQRLMSNPSYAGARPIAGLPCPVTSCFAYEIVTDKMYGKEGGAHLLAVIFASDQPAYPGLRLERPEALPTKPGEAPQFFAANDRLLRFDGPLYTFAALDANADIYQRSRADFEALLKSMVIDSK